ncbi:MAG: class I SAM-dependent methyltransferase [Acidobacteriota bacterium]
MNKLTWEVFELMFYSWKVKFLKTPRGNHLWRRWRVWRGDAVGDYGHLPDHIRKYAPGHRFADIGCMWGVNGDYAFLAEACGATEVKAVDVFGPTPEFEAKKQAQNSAVEFILGDACHPETIARVGVVDVVFCAGVLYHHPSPFDLLVALRRMCEKTLILRTSAIPEIKGLANAAIFYPMLKPQDRKGWDLRSLGVGRQVGISDGFEPHQGYGNWFWGLTPSCITSLLETAGFSIERRFNEPFSQTFICNAVAPAFAHRLPYEDEARSLGQRVSASGTARPS